MNRRGFCEDHELEAWYVAAKQEATLEDIINDLTNRAEFYETERDLLSDLSRTYRDLIETLEEKKPIEDQGD
jgi:hypothetical protein